MNDMRQRGKTIVLVTHRPNIIGITTKLLLLREGVGQLYGPTDQVLAALNQQNQQAQQAAAQAQAQAQAEAQARLAHATPATVQE
jgi:ATP-binding cassette subfamily C exporter for protease/lipase